MAIATLIELKDQLSFTGDIGSYDDTMLQAKLDAAHNHVERVLGFGIETSFGGDGQEPVPPVLKEAVLMLAAWWYEQRETALVDGSAIEVPFGVREILNEYREFTF